MHLRFSFIQERYFLPFSAPKETQKQEKTALPSDIDLDDFNGITEKLTAWVTELEAEHKVVLFREAKPVSLEEHILIKTGKTLFLPAAQDSLFEEEDPRVQKTIITKEVFTQYLESIGVMPSFFDAAIKQFLESKRVKQIISDIWEPLCFKEYVIGYIHVWLSKADKEALDYAAVQTLSEYANTIVASLQKKEYFENFSLKDKFISAQGVNISAGGIRFSYPQSFITGILLLDTEVLVKLITPKRSITIKTKILRRYEEKGSLFCGCHFLDMAPEDVRFLYEYIYGKPFADTGGAYF
jgi:hypothetical protein